MAGYVQNAPIILASRSPRRYALLRQAGLAFSVIPSSVENHVTPPSEPPVYARVLAEKKAQWVSGSHPESWVIGADTIVVKNGAILEKPESPSAAKAMLRMLSGTTHAVYTGYALSHDASGSLFSDTVLTHVTFKPLTESEIAWYASTDEPYDKAGGYAIQGLGTLLVKHIQGSYTCVVGLPVCEIMDFFIKRKIIEMQRRGSGLKGGQ